MLRKLCNSRSNKSRAATSSCCFRFSSLNFLASSRLTTFPRFETGMKNYLRVNLLSLQMAPPHTVGPADDGAEVPFGQPLRTAVVGDAVPPDGFVFHRVGHHYANL